ncbi:MAG: succinate dehydrogenase cytochrome b subunit [Cyclobacteriaceae bacterium]|jgi:succinate dehydrogenase / fumarate reductase cytochrome b subunit|nr:succinate dehydrogenase cytochrome b subunit [Cyclobacteriaceae bacterium]
MKWFTTLFSSALGRKLLMALTGLFLITFLVVHLIGNLQLLKDDGGQAFNIYSEFMGHNPLIQTISKVNFALIMIHVVWAILITRQNRAARGQGYAINNKSSHWTSRNMGILGTIVLIFLVVHLRHFYAELHWGTTPMVTYDGKEMNDAYTLVAYWFSKAWYSGLYVVCMIGLAFHLWHGFASAFQTLGLNHVKYNPVISFVGRAFAIIVPALFALIPIMMFLK